MIKEERIKIYKEIEKQVIGKSFVFQNPRVAGGFCCMIYRIGNKDDLEEFPEILEHEPPFKYDDMYWFTPGDWTKRLEILRKIISDYENIQTTGN